MHMLSSLHPARPALKLWSSVHPGSVGWVQNNTIFEVLQPFCPLQDSWSVSKTQYYVLNILADLIIGYSHWAKDIIFVIGDQHLTGMHAWLSAYHHEIPSSPFSFIPPNVFIRRANVLRPPDWIPVHLFGRNLERTEHWLSRSLIFSPRCISW